MSRKPRRSLLEFVLLMPLLLLIATSSVAQEIESGRSRDDEPEDAGGDSLIFELDSDAKREPSDAGPETVYGKDFCRCHLAGRTANGNGVFSLLRKLLL